MHIFPAPCEVASRSDGTSKSHQLATVGEFGEGSFHAQEEPSRPINRG